MARVRWQVAAGLLILLGLAALLVMGALKARRDFLTRGLVDGLPEPVAHGGPRLGLNVYLQGASRDELDAQLRAIADLDIQYVKQPFYYPGTADAFDWTSGDRIVESVRQHGLTLVPLLDGDPEQDFAPPRPEDFAAWAGAFATRYGEVVDHYIIWDEPNLASRWGGQAPNPAEYAALLSAASQAIRAADAGAVIVAAPLAPTTESGPTNLSDLLYLEALYEAGAAPFFDVAAAKPYGFDTDPEDRTADALILNFSRAILLREVMEDSGDASTALWAGNWGWNSLPAGWQGRPSLWGQTDEATQAAWTVGGFERARREWPWMGLMFLENWQPAARPDAGVADDPRWGFSVAGRGEGQSALAAALQELTAQPAIAFPGFHPADPAQPAQTFQGGWEFSAEFGADISQSGDRATLRFWGTDVGLRVRRANYRARFYASVDGQPANALPEDQQGTALVLTAPSGEEATLSTVFIARNLPPGVHELVIVADEGWDQWALRGFSVAYHPPESAYRMALTGLGLLAALSFLLAVRIAWRADWRSWRPGARLSRRWQAALTVTAALLVTLSGWLIWGVEAAGLYRRLSDGSQLALTAAAASLFYVAPSIFVFVPALLLLLFLLYLRPTWGLAIIAFSFPFYVTPKPMLGYQFSPVEVFILVTLAAFLLHRLTFYSSRLTPRLWPEWHPADVAVLIFVAVATLSLPFTERLDVATNEWRVLIVEPALFYFLIRAIRPSEREMWLLLDAFVLGGLVIALHTLGQYVTGIDLITAEGGLQRAHSIYGSPNNVALYLGRVLPIPLAVGLLGSPANGRRRLLYAVAAVPLALAIMVTFSKGALFLGLPAALVVIFIAWLQASRRRIWLWLAGASLLLVVALLVALQLPALAARLDPQGVTGAFRLYLWQASLNMIEDHPIFGVGLDNFLYAYRGRYIFQAAWQEPDLSHPHNIILDFATRLGIVGLLAGGWLIWQAGRALTGLRLQVSLPWQPVVVGLIAGLADMIFHGLVDHSFFLVDLALAFYLILGTAVWLEQRAGQREHRVEAIEATSVTFRQARGSLPVRTAERTPLAAENERG